MARRCYCGDFDCVQSGRKPILAPAEAGAVELIERLGESPARRHPRRRDIRGWKHGHGRHVRRQWALHERHVGQIVAHRTGQNFLEGEENDSSSSF